MERSDNEVTTHGGGEQESVERSWVSPAVDVFESEVEYLLVADMPGVQVDELHLDLDGGELTLEGTRGSRSGYRRVFRVPDTVDVDKVGAEMAEGVLRVHLPKQERVLPRRIEVQAG